MARQTKQVTRQSKPAARQTKQGTRRPKQGAEPGGDAATAIGNGTSASSGRRGEILRVAEAVFAQKGFVNATVRDIGDASGILSGSLYYHFDSKETMLEDILRELLQQLHEALGAVLDHEGDVPTLFREMVDVSLSQVLQRPDGFRILHNEYGFLHSTDRFAFVETALDDVKLLWRQLITRGISDGSLRPDVDVRMLTLVIFHSTLSVVRWRKMPTPKNVKAVAEELARLVIEGAINRADTTGAPASKSRR